MTKIRLCFLKTGPLRYIGHLDLLKVFQQTIRRAGLPMAYSQGFNPHMMLSFALPLPLGMASCNDYADIILEHEMPMSELILKFNDHAPEGLCLKDAWKFEGHGAAALVSAGDYLLEIPSDKNKDDLNKSIQTLLTSEAIVIPKKTKSGVKDTDIRPDILHISLEDSGILLRLAAGSGRFLNPLIVAKLILGQDVSPSSIIRHELYRQDNSKGLISLHEAPIF